MEEVVDKGKKYFLPSEPVELASMEEVVAQLQCSWSKKYLTS